MSKAKPQSRDNTTKPADTTGVNETQEPPFEIFQQELEEVLNAFNDDATK